MYVSYDNQWYKVFYWYDSYQVERCLIGFLCEVKNRILVLVQP